MTTAEKILKVLKADGYRINPEIELAVDDMLDIVDEENDDMESDDEDALDDLDDHDDD